MIPYKLTTIAKTNKQTKYLVMRQQGFTLPSYDF